MKHLIINELGKVKLLIETDDIFTIEANMEHGDVLHDCPEGFDMLKHEYNPSTGTFSVKGSVASNELKSQKLRDISTLTVTVSSGKVFDGDETSQDRLARAISTASITGETSVSWKLADNSIVECTIDELKEALVLATHTMRTIWLN